MLGDICHTKIHKATLKSECKEKYDVIHDYIHSTIRNSTFFEFITFYARIH